MAFSTLKRTTSPHLSAILLELSLSSTANPSVQNLIKNTSNDLRRVADEFARIKREFEGAVNLTVSRYTVFDTVLGMLNVRFFFCGVDHNL